MSIKIMNKIKKVYIILYLICFFCRTTLNLKFNIQIFKIVMNKIYIVYIIKVIKKLSKKSVYNINIHNNLKYLSNIIL